MQNISRSNTLRKKVDVIFLSTLSRPATRIEMELMLQELSNYGPVKDGGNAKIASDSPYIKGYKNIISALLNTRQHMFLQ